MAHETALRVARYIEAAQAITEERRLYYFGNAYEPKPDQPFCGCALGMLFLGKFLNRRGFTKNAVKAFRKKCQRGRVKVPVAHVIARYAHIPEKLAYAIEKMHLREERGCQEIIEGLQSGALDELC